MFCSVFLTPRIHRRLYSAIEERRFTEEISIKKSNILLWSASISTWSRKKRHSFSRIIDAQNQNFTTFRSPLCTKERIYILHQQCNNRLFERPTPPHRTACGWIAASWRWSWSIRSINRDYCNPGGQNGGTGARRVHTTHTSSEQIWARMANIWPWEAANSPLLSGHFQLYSVWSR